MRQPIQLTFDGRLKFSPAFHPSGRWLCFSELATPELLRIQRLDLETLGVEPLHPEAKTSELEPAVAADGQQYAYVRTTGALTLSAVTRRWGGEVVGSVPPPPGFAGYRSPVLSPAGDEIVYSFAEGGRQQIFASRLDGTQRRVLIDSPGINNWPHFSPDGSRLVFGSSRDGNFEIYLSDGEGRAPRRLTDSPRQDIRPRFSPAGDQIAFVSHRDGNAQIYLMNVDGGDLRRVTESDESSDFPDWHPDGRKLAFISERQGRHDLCLVEL